MADKDPFEGLTPVTQAQASGADPFEGLTPVARAQASGGDPFEGLTPAAEPTPPEATGSIRPDEVGAIAAKHGLSAGEQEAILSLVPAQGVSVEGRTDSNVGGQVSALTNPFSSMGWGMAKRMPFHSEGFQAAMDEVGSLIEQRKTGAQTIAEIPKYLATGQGALGVGEAAGAAAGLPPLVSKAAGVGLGALTAGTQGAIMAKEGEEGQGALLHGGLAAAGATLLPPLLKGAKAVGWSAPNAIAKGTGALAERFGASEAASKRIQVGLLTSIYGGAAVAFKDKEGDFKERAEKGALGGTMLGLGAVGLSAALPSLRTRRLAEGVSNQVASLLQKDSPARVEMDKNWEGVFDAVGRSLKKLPWEEHEKEAAQGIDLVGFRNYLLRNEAPVSAVETAASDLASWYKTGNRAASELRRSFEDYTSVKLAKDLMHEEVVAKRTVDPSVFHTITRLFQRAPAAAAIIDDRIGTEAEKAVIEHALSSERSKSWSIAFFNEEAPKLDKLNQQVDASIQDAFSKGDAVPEEHRVSLETFASLFRSFKDKTNEEIRNWNKRSTDAIKDSGLPNYIARVVKNPTDTIETVYNQAKELGKPLAQITEEDLGTPAYTQLRESLSWLTGFEGLPQAGEALTQEGRATLQGVFKQVVDPTSVTTFLRNRKASQILAGSLRHREEDSAIPLALRETNLGRIFATYASDTSRDLFTREATRDLVKQTNLARAAGDFEGAKWLDDHITSVTTGLTNTVPAYLSKKTAALVGKWKSEGRTGALSLASLLPWFQQSGGTFMYAKLMGGSLNNTVKGLGSLATGVGAELGAAGDSVWAAKHVAQAALGLREASFLPFSAIQKDFKDAVAMGYIPKSTSAEAADVFANGTTQGLRDAGVVGKGLLMAEKAAQASMLLDKTTETFNRIVAFRVGRAVTDELFAGKPQALAWLATQGRGVREAVERELTLNKAASVNGIPAPNIVPQVQDLITQGLIGRSLHYYSPEHQAQIGKYLGRAVGALSMWPTATATDVLRRLYKGQEGELEAVHRYLAPFAYLTALDTWMDGKGEEAETRKKAFMGAEGFKGLSPVMDISRTFKPETPFTGAPAAVIQSAAKGDAIGVGRAITDGALTFTPLALIDMAIDRVSRYGVQGIKGVPKEKPDQDSTAERLFPLITKWDQMTDEGLLPKSLRLRK